MISDTEIAKTILQRRPGAQAQLRGSAQFPEIRGHILFYETTQGLLVTISLSGLPDREKEKACHNGIYGLHIHQGKFCRGNEEDPFADTGPHYNPDGCPHPQHAGDLPPIFSNNGTALSAILTDRLNIKEIVGKTVALHSMPDDFTSQPSGNSGQKIACGPIKRNYLLL